MSRIKYKRIQYKKDMYVVYYDNIQGYNEILEIAKLDRALRLYKKFDPCKDQNLIVYMKSKIGADKCLN